MPRTVFVSAACMRLFVLLIGLSLLTSVVQSWPHPQVTPQTVSTAKTAPASAPPSPPSVTEVVLYGHQLVSAQRAWVDGAGGAAWRHLAGCRPDLRGWEHAYLQAQFFPPHFALVDLPADIQAIAFSPDGRYLAAGFAAAPAKVWDVRTGQELRPTTPYPTGVKRLQFSRDGARIASLTIPTANADSVQVWETPSGTILLQRPSDSDAVTIAFSPDGKRLAISGEQKMDNTIVIYEVDTRQPCRVIDIPVNQAFALDFNPSGQTIVYAALGESIRIYHVNSGKEIQHFSEDVVFNSRAAFSPNGKYLAVCNFESIHILSLATGQPVITLTGHTATINELHYTADGTELVSSSQDDTVRIWDVRGGPALAKLPTLGTKLTHIATSARGNWLAITDQWGNHGSQIRLWQHRNLYFDPNAIDVHGRDDLALVPRDGIVPIGGLGGSGIAGVLGVDWLHQPMWSNTVRLMQPFRSLPNRPGDGMLGLIGSELFRSTCHSPQQQLLFERWPGGVIDPPLGTVSFLTLPRDGQAWYTVQGDGNVYGRSWVTRQRQLTHKLHPNYEGWGDKKFARSHPICMACSPDGAWLAVGTKLGLVRTINVHTNQRGPDLFAPDAERGSIMGVLFHPNGQHVYFAHADHSVWRSKLQPKTTPELIVAAPTLPGTTLHTGMALDPTGRWLAYHDGITVTLRDAHSGNIVRTLPGRAGLSNGLCFSPDGRLLAGAADHCMAQVWDVASGQIVWQTTGERGQMLALTFSPDGQRLVLSDGQRRISGWDRHTGKMVFRIPVVNLLVHSLAFTPDGRRLVASAVGPQASVERLAPWTAAVELPPFEANMFVQQWDARTDQLDRTFVWFADTPTHAALDHAGTRALTHHTDASTKLWDTRTGQRCTDAYLPSDFRAPISGDGRWRIVCAGDDLQLHAVDPDPAAMLRRVNAVDIDWHRQRAAQVDQAEQFAAAAFHLGILMQAKPSNPYHRLRRGLARVAAGDLGEGHDVGWGVLQLLVTPKWPTNDWPLPLAPE